MITNKISNKISNGVFVILFFIIFLIMNAIINGKPFGVSELKEISGGIGILDMEFNYDTNKVYALLSNLGEEGRSFYLNRILLLDFIFPIAYCLFLTSCILFFIKKTNFPFEKISILPSLALIMDYTENILIINILLNYPKKIPKLVSISNIFTLSKFTLIFSSNLIIVIGIITFMAMIIKKRLNERK